MVKKEIPRLINRENRNPCHIIEVKSGFRHETRLELPSLGNMTKFSAAKDVQEPTTHTTKKIIRYQA